MSCAFAQRIKVAEPWRQHTGFIYLSFWPNFSLLDRLRQPKNLCRCRYSACEAGLGAKWPSNRKPRIYKCVENNSSGGSSPVSPSVLHPLLHFPHPSCLRPPLCILLSVSPSLPPRLYNLARSLSFCCRSGGNPSLLSRLRRSAACPIMVWGYPPSPPDATHIWAGAKRSAGGIPCAGASQ